MPVSFTVTATLVAFAQRRSAIEPPGRRVLGRVDQQVQHLRQTRQVAVERALLAPASDVSLCAGRLDQRLRDLDRALDARVVSSSASREA